MSNHAEGENNVGDAAGIFLLPLVTVIPLIFLFIAWIVSRVTKNRVAVSVATFPAALLLTNCGLALLLVPVAFLMVARHQGVPFDPFSWAGEITLAKPIWMPMLVDFWYGLGHLFMGTYEPLPGVYFAPIVYASPVTVIVVQGLMWWFVGRKVNDVLTSIVHGS